MRNFIGKLFGRNEKPTAPVAKRSHFLVEFYPITGRYYPKYKDLYLQRDWKTGIVITLKEFLFMYADYGETEEEADKIIELFKEQALKENVRTIQK